MHIWSQIQLSYLWSDRRILKRSKSDKFSIFERKNAAEMMEQQTQIVIYISKAMAPPVSLFLG